MKGKIRKGSTGWNSSDSEDDNKKNISSDEEDLQKAVQDLGLVIIGMTVIPMTNNKMTHYYSLFRLRRCERGAQLAIKSSKSRKSKISIKIFDEYHKKSFYFNFSIKERQI
jgi:hypothetical protein